MEFTIYGEPQGKGRPRFSTRGGAVRSYTPEKTVAYEEEVREAFLAVGETGYFDKEPLVVDIKAYFQIPKSTPKKRIPEVLKGFPMKKPDIDNIAKIILDGLNGWAYEDDSQVITLLVTKSWVEEDPRVEVTIWQEE